MNLAGKFTVGATVVIVGGLVALAAPAVAGVHAELSSWAIFTPKDDSHDERETDVDPGGAAVDELGDGYVDVGHGIAIPRNSPPGCDEPAWLHLGAMSASLSGELVDRGARDFAEGSAILDPEGRVVSYSVAPGDALSAIGERFCLANAGTIATLNHTRTIHPGDTLLLHPNASLPWIPYFNPADAPGGYQQVPYQRAIEAMSEAAHAGDLDAMRAIFTDDLAGLFPDPADAELIADALAVGDLGVLRQMFA